MKQDFNWVEARAHCFPAAVFEKLRLQVIADVEIRNKYLADPRDQFAVVENGNAFSVIVRTNPIPTVTFRLSGEKIVVDRKGHLLCEASLTLNDDGECRVIIEGQERDFWQMRKSALEGLFFGG
ncbi:MAG: hypothetical protein ACLQVG_16925 [Terriglobia bacterium]